MFQSFRLYSHLFLLKLASRFGIWLGKCIIRMKKPRVVDYKNLETIYLNRSDRIGDAIISKPFIKLLIEWLRANGCSAEIVILASQYNRSILSSLEDIENNVRIISEEKPDFYESKLSRMISKHLNFLYQTLVFRWSHGNTRNEHALFFDMGGGDFTTILRYKELVNPLVIGPNVFWGSHILDIALEHSYVHYSNVNLIESYIEIIEKAFGLRNGFRDFIYDHLAEFYHYDTHIPKSGICLFIGVKEFRNLPVATWRRIILETAEAFPDETIIVLDDHTNLLYDIFIQEKFPANVVIEKNTYSLQGFTERVAKCAFVAGIDGGGINMVKYHTNSCFINTFAQPNVWSCFIGRHVYQNISGADNWQSSVVEIPPHKQIIAHMYKESFWLPSFNIDGNREIFSDFDTSLLTAIIRESLKK
ncbi:MAG: hypothetical protein PHH16_00675 [Candidatus Gracilibacteria bacterium]|nr:hypothetical protein [Candidatus Gracilibacteria bacterium]